MSNSTSGRPGRVRAGDSAWTGRSSSSSCPSTSGTWPTNVLAALTAYDALGLPLERAQEGAAAIALSAWRSDVRVLPGGGVVVNDAYNANPVSMRAALEDLNGARGRPAPGRGARVRWPSSAAHSDRYHGEVRDLLAELGIEALVAVGEPARAYLGVTADERWIPDAAAFVTAADMIRPGDAVLVKASRAVGLEGIAAEIEKLSTAW